MNKRNIAVATVAALSVAGLGLWGALRLDGNEVGSGEARGTLGTTAASMPSIEVWKGPRCDCCDKWIEHLQDAGFDVKVHEVANVAAVKVEKGIPPQLSTCHTAEVGGYLVEGHVPADAIQRLLKEKPDVAGLAVPGMPIGSPGMEEPGRPAERYSVVSFTKDGSVAVFERR
ncbi:MAG: DUF411 domain-containing protein [Gemmatimonadota bacterium]